MALYPHPDALVTMRGIDPATHPELRLEAAESNFEAAEHIWQMRARDFDAKPSEQTLQLARWAAEDFRDACDALEQARAAVAR